MRTVVLGDPPSVLASLIADRQRLGLDSHDEVWQGDYHMAPAPSYKHAKIGALLAALFQQPANSVGLQVSLDFNLGHPDDFRVPDLGVHRGDPDGVWLDTAAIVVEVRSPDDESLEKFGFYFEHGVEEVMICDLETNGVHWFLRSESEFSEASGSAILGLSVDDVQTEIGWNK
jgi:Uma2 family endonuclease